MYQNNFLRLSAEKCIILLLTSFNRCFSVKSVNKHWVWSSSKDFVVYLNFKVPENFMHLLFSDRFWFVPLQFVNMNKF